MDGLPIGVLLILIVLALVILVLWIILPFAVFGLKSRLDTTNQLLEAILSELRRGGGSGT